MEGSTGAGSSSEDVLIPGSNKGDRLSRAAEADFRPDSLVGSFFHTEAERGWQGCVVAEPAPGIYLVETFEWIVGTSHDQRLVRVDEMLGWRFYDDAKWMSNAYDNNVKAEWDHERGESAEGSAS
jgi:hypothetical protein